MNNTLITGATSGIGFQAAVALSETSEIVNISRREIDQNYAKCFLGKCNLNDAVDITKVLASDFSKWITVLLLRSNINRMGKNSLLFFAKNRETPMDISR